MHDLTTIQHMNAAMRASEKARPVKRGYRMEVRVQTDSTYFYLVHLSSPRRVYRQLRKVAPTLQRHKLLYLTKLITVDAEVGKPHTYHAFNLTIRIRRHDYSL